MYVRACVLHIYLCVPVADHIAAAMHRNRLGPFKSRSASPGDAVRAHGGRYQPYGASDSCCFSCTKASAQGSERTFPHQGKSILLLLAIHDWPAVWKPSGLSGMRIVIIVVEIFNL